MDKKYLLETAQQLKQVSVKSAEEYTNKSEQLISIMNCIMSERRDIEELIGKGNLNMMKDNHANHMRFLASIFKNCNFEVLVESILWVFRAYRSHGFRANYWSAQLNSWINLFKDELTPECYAEIYPYYDWMLINIHVFVKVSDQELDIKKAKH